MCVCVGVRFSLATHSILNDSVEVLVSPTEDMGKLLGSMHGVPTQGTSNFANAMQVAQVRWLRTLCSVVVTIRYLTNQYIHVL
jgi:hypothetical protein